MDVDVDDVEEPGGGRKKAEVRAAGRSEKVSRRESQGTRETEKREGLVLSEGVSSG